jgi:hypothetical protein
MAQKTGNQAASFLYGAGPGWTRVRAARRCAWRWSRPVGLIFAWLLAAGPELKADGPVDTQEQLRELRRQNQLLQDQLRNQQSVIDSLARKVSRLEEAPGPRQLGTQALEASNPAGGPAAGLASSPGLDKVVLSGEGGVVFFHTGRDGMFPNSEFRMDEARLFLEAPLGGEVYAYTELNLATRETPDVAARLGEAYLDFENVSRIWHWDRMLNLRLGRLYVPFGEEYQGRNAIDNPLISHSLSDLWGVDEGLELYGRLGPLIYVAAVQNGGIPDTQDFDRDKSVAGRIGWEPARWLHVSVSGMRTGDLAVKNDHLSALWFGNGFIRSLGSAQTTRFHANLLEADVEAHWPSGHVKAFGGYIRYGDNDPGANNGRDVFYYSVEGVQNLTGKFYAGARFSQILAKGGFPIVGNGEFTDYFFNSLTEEIWRLSLGLGYRWSQNLLLKAEYSFERGKELGGDRRNHEDLVALEAAFKF